jgi:hypothetical protein
MAALGVALSANGVWRKMAAWRKRKWQWHQRRNGIGNMGQWRNVA